MYIHAHMYTYIHIYIIYIISSMHVSIHEVGMAVRCPAVGVKNQLITLD